MSASFPTSVKSFTTKNNGDSIVASHVNDIQDEVMAIETGVIRALKKIYNVLDYGADPTGVADSTSAFQSAIAAAKSAAGTVYVPMGTYIITDTLDLRAASNLQSIALVGADACPILQCSISGASVITFGNGAAEGTGLDAGYTKIANLNLNTNSGALPTSQSSGQCGILASTYGTGKATKIDNIVITGFADDAIVIQGPTGPVAIRDCRISCCAGWGIDAKAGYNSTSPQDVNILGGSIQVCWGGVAAKDAASRVCVINCDIELGQGGDSGTRGGRYPCLYVEPSAQAFAAYNCSLSMNGYIYASPSPAAVVYCAGSGATFTGCLNQSSALALDNYLFDGPYCYQCSVIGGYASNLNSSSSGYVIHLTNNVYQFAAVNPGYNGGTYQSGKNVCYAPGQSGNNIASLCLGITY